MYPVGCLQIRKNKISNFDRGLGVKEVEGTGRACCQKAVHDPARAPGGTAEVLARATRLRGDFSFLNWRDRGETEREREEFF